MELNPDKDIPEEVVGNANNNCGPILQDESLKEKIDKVLDNGSIHSNTEEETFIGNDHNMMLNSEGTIGAKFSDHSADELSFNVSMTDMEMLNDFPDFNKGKLETNTNFESDDDIKDMNGDDEEDVDGDDDDDKVASLTNSFASLNDTETKETLFDQKSKLHCRLCGELYTDPKVLSCLHTFCAACLKNKIEKLEKQHKYIFCPVCSERTKLEKDVMSSFETNLVLVKLVEAQARAEPSQSCVVCKMHDEETAGTHVCKDCSDKLCKDCAEKHTFSRLTAKHHVIELENMDETEMRSALENKFGFCEKHCDERLQYICHDCNVAACRDCVMLSHKAHQCASQLELYTQMSQEFQKQMDSLKGRVDKLQESTGDGYKEDLDLLQETETKQVEYLQKIADDVIETINTKVSKALEELHEEYRKKRNFCQTRKSYIQVTNEKVDETVDLVNFLLKEGTGSEILPLQKKINGKLSDLNKVIDLTFPRVKDLKKLPEVKPVQDNIELLKRFSFFVVHSYKPSSHEKDSKVAVNQKSQMAVMQKQQEAKKKGSKKPTTVGRKDPIQPLLSVGRGQLLSKPSLLGEYPGLHHQGNQQYKQSYNKPGVMAGTNPQTPTIKGFNEQSLQGAKPKSSGSLHFPVLFKFQSMINIGHRMDQTEGRIMGLTFVDNMKFVVSDVANNRLTMFNTAGVALDMVQDMAPMSVTSCNGTLIWNAEFNKIKMYNGQTNSVDVMKQFKWGKMMHPITSFRQEKYLVLNRENNSIEAYNLSNKCVHRMKPKDQSGKVIQDIGNIAARETDQVVVINPQTNKLIVTDFDGNWIGEYSERRWKPGCAAIDFRNNIFVTDTAQDRLLLLDSRGKFMCMWRLKFQHPFCIACNGQGDLILSGEGGIIYHFMYRYY